MFIQFYFDDDRRSISFSAVLANFVEENNGIIRDRIEKTGKNASRIIYRIIYRRDNGTQN